MSLCRAELILGFLILVSLNSIVERLPG